MNKSVKKCIVGIMSLAMLTFSMAPAHTGAVAVQDETNILTESEIQEAEYADVADIQSQVDAFMNEGSWVNYNGGAALLEGESDNPNLEKVLGDHTTEDGLMTYKITEYSDDKYITICSCDDAAAGPIEIPETIDGVQVRFIASNAFFGCSGITSVKFPPTIKRIYSNAFGNCFKLETVDLPGPTKEMLEDDNLDNDDLQIDGDAFYQTLSLKSIDIPEGTISVGASAFVRSGIESASLPSTLKSTGDFMFAGCPKLSKVTLSEGLTRIRPNTFLNCMSLTQITFPKSLTSIMASAFQYSGLTSVDVPDNVVLLSSLAFSKCQNLETAKLGTGVGYISNNVFSDCINLKSVTLPDNLTDIRTSAFSGCNSLDNVVIPSTVTRISAYAFAECSSLSAIEIPEGITQVDRNTFYNCKKLASVKLPSTITSIATGAFQGCEALPEIVIPDTVTSVGAAAFSGCKSAKTLTMSKNVTNISDYAFAENEALETINWSGSETKIGKGAFSNCTSLTSVTIPENVKTIGIDAFRYDTALEKAKMNDKLLEIGDKAFAGSGLKEIEVPNPETQIGRMAIGYTGIDEEMKFSDIPVNVIADPVSGAAEYVENEKSPAVRLNGNNTKETTQSPTESSEETTTTVKPSEEVKVRYGDVNMDGTKNISDVVLACKSLSGGADLVEMQVLAADVDLDGNVTSTDVVYIMRALIGDVELPVTGDSTK